MKKAFTILVIAAVSLGMHSCSSDSPEVVDDDQTKEVTNENTTENVWSEPTPEDAVILTTDIETRAIRKTNSFSYKLLNALQEDLSNLDNKNIFISPLSVSMAMSMTANGAVDETRDEIINALGYTDITTIDGINQVNAKLLAALPNADPDTKFAIANALWFNKDYVFYDYFKNINSTYYNAAVQSLDFSQSSTLETINQWASDNTNGLIQNLVKELDSRTALLITDALYFKGDWTEPFENYDGYITFTNYNGKSVDASAFGEVRNMLYNSNYKCEVVTLPFGNGSYKFSVVLPKSGISVSEAVSSLSNDTYDNSVETLVSFSIPKFAFENDLTLNKYLQALNIKRAFTGEAQFPRITNQALQISQVGHVTKIDLNENGVEAAAATVVEMEMTATGDEPKYKTFTVNRPFAFVIRETTTGAIVFIGAVNEL